MLDINMIIGLVALVINIIAIAFLVYYNYRLDSLHKQVEWFIKYFADINYRR